MAFWKNLRYIFSDEFSSWIHYVVKNYNQKSEKNEKSLDEMTQQLQRVAEKQSILETNISDSRRELKENKDDMDKVALKCEDVFSQCESIYTQVSQPDPEPEFTREYIEQYVGEALAKQSAESAQRSQILSARIREVYALIESQNEKDPDEPDVNDLMARIEILEKENKEYQDQIGMLQNELNEVSKAQQTSEANYKNEKRKNYDLSKRLVQADDKIKDLVARVKDKDLEDMLFQKEIDSPFIIIANKDKYRISAGNMHVMVAGFTNTMVLDQFFEKVPAHDPYKKMYNRYQHNIRSAAGQAAGITDIGKVLHVFIEIVQEDLVKIIESIYRRMKSANAEFEEKLLDAINQYLEAVGFYCRDDIKEGELLTEKDLEDMECIKDERTAGRQHGEIVEIEVYPYYINYVDRGGRRRQAHTKGSMTVIA